MEVIEPLERHPRARAAIDVQNEQGAPPSLVLPAVDVERTGGIRPVVVLLLSSLNDVRVSFMLFRVEQQAPERPGLLSALTTEHFTLQSARSSMITESLGRTTIYLGTLSATLVALALVIQGETTEEDFRLFALILLPALIFLGTVTFVRVIENSIEDTIYVMAINRIRHYYIEQAGEDARYFTLAGQDDLHGAYANMGLASSRWRPFFSIGAVLALINSMVVGALAGVAIDAVASREIAVMVGTLVTAAAFAIHYRAGWSRYRRAIEGHTPIFPSKTVPRE